jgi:hypothetical protein
VEVEVEVEVEMEVKVNFLVRIPQARQRRRSSPQKKEGGQWAFLSPANDFFEQGWSPRLGVGGGTQRLRWGMMDGNNSTLPRNANQKSGRRERESFLRFVGCYPFDTTASAAWDGSSTKEEGLHAQSQAVLWQSRPRLLIATFDIEVSATNAHPVRQTPAVEGSVRCYGSGRILCGQE